MNKPYYNINHVHFANLLMPVILRRPKITAFIKAQLIPLVKLQQEFVRYIDTLDVTVNSQVCRMQKLINDNFDFDKRRIRVENAVDPQKSDFLIRFPDGYTLTEKVKSALILLVNQNKLATKRFEIVGGNR